MSTTIYTITAGDTVVASKSKKSVALDVALAYRNENGVDVTVTTGAGTVVAQIAAPKKIKMSAPYTRVVPVPNEIVETINGQRVAYKRTRVGFALLDAARGAYTIWDLERNVAVGDLDIATTREAGRWFADEAPAFRASLATV